MKIPFMDILKNVGTSLIKEVPGGELALSAVNAFLPDGNKLGQNSTVDQAKAAVESLSSADKAVVMAKEFDVQIAEINSWEKIQGHLTIADASGSSTRPFIALMMAWTVVIAVLVFMFCWGWAVVSDATDMIDKLKESWQLVVAVIGTPTVLLRSYFGMRTKEKTSRYAAATDQPINVGAISSMVRLFKR